MASASYPSLTTALYYSTLCIALGLCLTLIAKKFIADRQRNPRRLPLPPGPRGLPILGNVLQIPQDRPWIGYHDLCKEYGDLVYLNALGVDILVVDTLDKAMELMDKRSANYSDRPVLAVSEICGTSKWNFAVMQYGPRWRQLRRTFHTHFGPSTLSQYHPIMYEENRRFLGRLRDNPGDFANHIKLLFGTIIMRVSYGFEDLSRNQYLINDVETFFEGFGEAMKPGNLLVNIFPSLKYIPEWFPGAGWKKTLRMLTEISEKVRWAPFEDAKANMDRRYPSLATSVIDNLPEEGPEREDAEALGRDVAVMAYLAGNETSVATATGLIIALANHPEVQERAYAEIEAVVGHGRLPMATDREALPYVHAIVKEIGRWYPVVPMGLAHSSSEDDEYQGYFIPKGTLVMANAWAIMHDPNTFPEPFEFNPERYLKDGRIDYSIPDGEQAVFGFGRRICPGRHLSNDALFVFAASLLSTFVIEAPRDEAGKPIHLELNVTNHFVSKPLPFECTFRQRPGREHLIY